MRLSLLLIAAFAKCILALPVAEETAAAATAAEREWWQTAVFYQIYPRSFMDSNGDGIGDLKGFTSKLQHLVDIGVTSTWLSPIFKSPMVDAGYDISNFVEIEPDYGTMEDFEKLTATAKKLGLRVVLDFVPNHSSDKHEWFTKSIKRVDPYTNYYIWADAKMVNGSRQPPNNWISEFHGSAWEWNSKRGQYYLHQFAVGQPDLNYRDPNLVEEMKNVLRFWMKKGVAGFRVDTIPSLFEDTTQLDEPLSNNPGCLPTDYCYLDHIYTKDRPQTYDMVVQWRNVLKEFSAENNDEPKVIMTESYSPIDKLMGYYGNATHDGACFSFNFLFITDVNGNSTAQSYKETIDKWVTHLPKGRTSNWVLGNHDNHRVATRYGIERADGLNMMTMSMPGVAVTYNGEEIGMEDGFVSWEDTQDPNALNAGEDRYLLFTRDPERTPFQWDDSKNAGFSTGDHTWLPVSDKYLENNVKKQTPKSVDSHYHVYQQLTALRSAKTFTDGSLKYDALGDNILAIVRELKGDDTYVTVINISNKKEQVDLSSFKTVPSSLTVEVASVDSTLKKGDTVKSTGVPLGPHEAYILKGKP